MVITALTRNFGRTCDFRPPASPWCSSTQKISKSNIFCFLSCFLPNEFLSKFLEENMDWNRYGELSEWSKVQHSKFFEAEVVSSNQNPWFIGVLMGSHNWIFCCSTLQFYPKDFLLISLQNVVNSGEHIRRGIEVVITGLTRNPPRLRLSRPPVSLCFQGFSRVLKTKYFAVLTRRSNILVFPLFWGSRCSDRV